MATKEKLLQKLYELLSNYPKNETEKITEAYEFSNKYHLNQKRASGEEFITHPLAIAINLAQMNVDYEMIIAGLLHDVVEDTDATLDDIEQNFGVKVSKLVDGVTKISKLKQSNKNDIKAETIRKMLFAMITDMKVIIIKLSDKLHNMNTLNFIPIERRRRIAKETLEIYAPLAGKIGMHFIKDQLEDLALKWLYPEVYETIKKHFDRIEKDREIIIKLINRIISEKLKTLNIPFKIKSRTKHFFSIYKKMKKFNKKIEEIFDIHGIRIITDTVNNCYQIFGIIHNLWQPIPGRFRDFIAHPKKNGYRSLHTTVIFERRKAVEIQIRTEEMDEFNEFGVASHWYYKKGKEPNTDQLKWLSKLMDVHKEKLTPEEYYETLRDDILKDEIYIFTPKGDVIEMPKGSTPIDYAYRIHTEIGHRCKGAKANGIIIPLHTALKNGMIVEILLDKNENPKTAWLSIVKTNQAKKKIRNWLAHNINKEEEKEEKKELVDKKKIKQGQKKISPLKKIKNEKINVEVNGEKNLLVNYAKCCNPLPPDEITGFVSRGRGIIIHRKNCYSLKYIKEIEKRTIEVSWEKKENR